jgi:hypothetical protein
MKSSGPKRVHVLWSSTAFTLSPIPAHARTAEGLPAESVQLPGPNPGARNPIRRQNAQRLWLAGPGGESY